AVATSPRDGWALPEVEQTGCGYEREGRKGGQQVVAQLPLGRGEDDHRRGHPAEEEAQAGIAQPVVPPRLPEGDDGHGGPGQRDRREMLHVEEQVVAERARRIGGPPREPSRQVAKIAPQQVLAHEEHAPAAKGGGVPAEPEDEERDDPRSREEGREATPLALPDEKASERHREEHRRDGPLGERRGAEQREGGRRGMPSAVAPPAEGEPQRRREEQHEQHVRTSDAGASKERRHGPEERRRDEPRRSSEKLR